MKNIKYHLEKAKKLTIPVIILLLLLIILLIPNNKEKEEVALLENVEIEQVNEETKTIELEKIKVDVKGAVINTGVYELNIDSRVQDAINAAGGLSENANVEYINLSKKLKDEMVIIIYTNEYIEKYKEGEEKVIYIKYKCDCPDEINESCIDEKNLLNETESKEDLKEENKEEESKYEDTLISINLGTLDELMTLNGIGESKAKAIIEYREKNGEFKALEDIMNVSGIGESAYSKIKDNIKL